MLIGELSRRTAVNSHQLRYYEAQGLLSPERAPSGYREYTDDDIVTVKQIRRLLEAGLTTEQIAYLQPCTTGDTPDLDPCQETLDTLRTRRAELDRRIDGMVETREALHMLITDTERAESPAQNASKAHAPELPRELSNTG